jgi:hypothetical protein
MATSAASPPLLMPRIRCTSARSQNDRLERRGSSVLSETLRSTVSAPNSRLSTSRLWQACAHPHRLSAAHVASPSPSACTQGTPWQRSGGAWGAQMQCTHTLHDIAACPRSSSAAPHYWSTAYSSAYSSAYSTAYSTAYSIQHSIQH